MLTIDVLYYDDCPHYKKAIEALKAVLAEEDADAEVRTVRVEPGEQADIWGFLGSPTILINGQDLEPEADTKGAFQGHCRMYMWHDQLSEYPPEEMIREALKRFA